MIKIRGLPDWIRMRVSWQLGLALLLSLLLHLGLLAQIHWPDWLSTDDRQATVLQARLVLPPAPSTAAVVPVPQSPMPSKPAAKKAKPPSPVPAPAEPDVAVSPPAVQDEAVAPASEAEAGIEDPDWAEAGRPLPEDDVALPEPYQAVTTEFAVYVNGETSAAGSATIEFVLESAQQYRLRWAVEGRGLLKLLYPRLVQESRGEVRTHGLRPQYYRYAFGSRADKTYEAKFDWDAKLLTLIGSKGEQHHDLPQNTQDLLSFMYQFMFVPPLQEMQVALTNGRRLGEYEYEFEGEETLQVGEHTIQAVHIAHTRGETDEKIELWLASDYRYVPVKIRKVEKSGMVIEQVATQLNSR